MNLTELESILSEQSENKFCPICATPFKPHHSRQKTCGSPECKKAYHAEYVKNYNRRLRKEHPYETRERKRESMRKFRARQKAVEDRNDELGRQQEYWEKRAEFEQKIAKYGDKYGEVQAQQILERVPKIDTSMGGDNDGSKNDQDNL